MQQETVVLFHGDAITWKCFALYCPLVRRIHRSPVNPPPPTPKGPVMFSLKVSILFVWISWTNSRFVGDLRRLALMWRDCNIIYGPVHFSALLGASTSADTVCWITIVVVHVYPQFDNIYDKSLKNVNNVVCSKHVAHNHILPRKPRRNTWNLCCLLIASFTLTGARTYADVHDGYLNVYISPTAAQSKLRCYGGRDDTPYKHGR